MNINHPIPVEWDRYVTQMGSGLEVIPHMLYDTATYVDATTVDLPFFNAVRATLDLGNLQQPGMLPNPQSFLIENIRLYFKVNVFADDQGAAGAFASRINDIVLLVNTGVFRLTIGEKRYGPWPLWTLPASTFVKGMLAVAGAEAANLVTDYGQVDGPLYGLFPNLMISPLQNFQVNLEWPAGTVNTTANVVTQVLFDGKLARAIQ